MSNAFTPLAKAIATSPLHDWVVSWLRTVPGLPPIVQTIHILSIGCIMGSIVMINLRVLGLAVPSQNVGEMIRRLMPWMWTALVMLLLSGSMFVIARPGRYFVNPIFGIKFALLIPAVALAFVLQRLHRPGLQLAGLQLAGLQLEPPRLATKIIAALSLLLWLGVVLAGRWIAYLDYLLPME